MKLFLLSLNSVFTQNCDRPEEKISGFCGKRQDTLNAKAGYDKAAERYLAFGFKKFFENIFVWQFYKGTHVPLVARYDSLNQT